jgi:hypothetical protein
MYRLICLETYFAMGQDNVTDIVIMVQTGRPRKYGSTTGCLQEMLIINNFARAKSDIWALTC